jgi:5,10-methenyltetrahydrofolate synthetase
MTTAPSSAEHTAESSAVRTALRNEKLAARMALDATRHTTLGAQVAIHLDALLATHPPQTLAFCAPIHNEFDARPLVAKLIAQGWHAAMPVVEAPATPMRFRRWQPDAAMTEGPYGIPIPAKPDYIQPTLLLLPLVAFDARAYRLGYGGGYFDRTLATMVPRPLTVGIGFELSRTDTIHPLDHDIALDCIVTEAGVFCP